MKYHKNNVVNNFIKLCAAQTYVNKNQLAKFLTENKDVIGETELRSLLAGAIMKQKSKETLNANFEDVIENASANGFIEFGELKHFIDNGICIEDVIGKVHNYEIKVIHENEEISDSQLRELSECIDGDEKSNRSAIVDGMSVYMKRIGENALLDKNEEIEIFKSIEESREKYARASMSCILTLMSIEKMNNYFDRGVYKVGDFIEGLKSCDEKHYSSIKLSDEDSLDDVETTDNGDKIDLSSEQSFDDESADENQCELENQKEIAAGVKAIFDQVKPLRLKMEEALNTHGEESSEYLAVCDEVVSLLSDVRFSQKAIKTINNDISKIISDIREQESKVLEIVKRSRIKSSAFKKAFIGNETNHDWYLSLDSKDLALIASYIPEINDIQNKIAEIIKPTLLTVKKLKSINTITSVEDKNISNKIDFMVKSNLRLVVSCAKKYYSYQPNLFEDFIQEGNIGLMKAVSKFIYRKGFKFSTYAVWWIKQSINGTIQTQSRTVRIPIYMSEHISKIGKIQDQYVKLHGCTPKPSYVAEQMGIPLEKLEKLLQNVNKFSVSMDAPIGEDESGSLFDLISDEQACDPVDIIENKNKEKAVNEILKNIRDERAAEVLRLRFGIGISHSQTLEEIGGVMNLTRERIRQIEAAGLKQLRSSRYINLVKELVDIEVN